MYPEYVVYRGEQVCNMLFSSMRVKTSNYHLVNILISLRLINGSLTLSTLSTCNYNGLSHSLFWIELKWSVGVKALIILEVSF